jgi:hypothetical protein
MTRKNFLTALIIFILLSLTASAAPTNEITTYPYVGGQSQNYLTGTYATLEGELQDNSNVGSKISRTVGDIRGVPLVEDLDGDGIKEIIVLSGNSVQIYLTNLSIAAQYPLNLTATYSTFPYIYDIDNDNNKEVLMASSDGGLWILEYNSTNLNVQTYSKVSGFTTPVTMGIACSRTDKCAVFHPIGSYAVNPTLRVSTFDSLGWNDTNQDPTGGIGNGYACLPQDRRILTYDYNSDGDDDYVVAYAEYNYISLDSSVIYWYTHDDNGEITATQLGGGGAQPMWDIGPESPSGSCDDVYRRPSLITSPTLFNEGGAEVVWWSQQSDEGEVTLQSYSTSASKAVDNVLTYFGGTIFGISNPFQTQFVGTDDDDGDVCQVFFRSDTNETGIRCYTDSPPFGISNNEAVIYAATADFTTDYDYEKPYMISHSIEAQTEFERGVNPDELLTPYGILQVQFPTAGISMNPFETLLDFSGQGAARWISVDFDNDGIQSLLGATNNNLIIIGDIAFNPPPSITQIELSSTSCFTNGYSVNSTITVTTTITDNVADIVRSVATPYFGTDNEFSVSSINSTPPATLITPFFANDTATPMTLRVSAYDFEEQTDIEEISVSVLSSGIYSTDCTRTVSFATPTSINESVAAINAQRAAGNDAISSTANFASDTTGLGTAPLWYLVIIIALGASFAIGAKEGTPALGAGIGVMLAVCLMFLGVTLGFIGIGIIIILAVLAFIGAAVYVTKFATGGGGSV